MSKVNENVINQLKTMGFSDDVIERPRRLIACVSGREKTGKCLTGDCTVLTEEGEVMRIDELCAGTRITSIDERGYPAVAVVRAVSLDGVRPVLRVTLSDGRTMKVTGEHKFYTRDGWREASLLSVNDRVLVPLHLSVQELPREDSHASLATPAEASILGYLIADGGLTSSSVRFTKGDTSIMDDFKANAQVCGFSLADYTYGDRTTTVGISGEAFLAFRKRFNLYNGAHGKELPEEVFHWPRLIQDVLLRSYFTCDGWSCRVTSGGLQVGACSASKQLIAQLTSLLLQRAIPVTVRSRVVNGERYWMLESSTTSALRFIATVGFVGSEWRKAKSLVAECAVVPKRQGYLATTDTHGRGEPVIGPAAMWAKVKSVCDLEEALPVYDVEIEGDLQCFVANNILVHNTHFALTAPDPIFFINIDIGAEGVLDKFQAEGKRIYVYDVRVPRTASKDVYAPMWENLKKIFEKVYQAGAGTVVVDTDTEAFELARLAKFGKLSQVLPHNYVEVNNEYREILRLAYDSSMNSVFLHKMKAKYVNDKRTGEYEPSGFGDMEYNSQVNIITYREDTDEGTEFSAFIKDCRHNPNVNGEWLKGEMCSFEFLLSIIHGE